MENRRKPPHIISTKKSWINRNLSAMFHCSEDSFPFTASPSLYALIAASFSSLQCAAALFRRFPNLKGTSTSTHQPLIPNQPNFYLQKHHSWVISNLLLTIIRRSNHFLSVQKDTPDCVAWPLNEAVPSLSPSISSFHPLNNLNINASVCFSVCHHSESSLVVGLRKNLFTLPRRP